MQEAVADVLPQLIDAEVEREVKIGERSRLDFLVQTETERVAIECKIDQTGRAAVYRQVRRYAEECGVTGVIRALGRRVFVRRGRCAGDGG